jgi:diphosphoinositol-polyphosphate diphosphatase
LVTGCVPILRGGKVLLVSSSRKTEWILPKGGWEQDEAIEESAVRECFEEAGVLGTLGQALSPVQHETRKAKKRRLEREASVRRMTTGDSAPDGAPKPEKDPAECDVDKGKSAKTESLPRPAPAATAEIATTTATSPVCNEDTSRIRGHPSQDLSPHERCKSSDDALSVASNVSGTYSQVRMTLFPLYVTEVHEDWPESGRFRKAVDIDEAIRLMEPRPEFRAALVEVKERGLHVLEGPGKATAATTTINATDSAPNSSK